MKKFCLLVFTFCIVLSNFGTITYAAEAGKWISKSELPMARTGAAVAAIEDKIYVFGGASNGASASVGAKTNTTFVYDTLADSWSQKENMPTARAGATASVIDGKIYVIGGYYGSSRTRTAVVEVYDAATDSWETKASLNTKRSWASSSVINETIYVFGGASSDSKSIASVEAYDLVNNVWIEKQPMPYAVNSVSSVTYEDKIYVGGGAREPSGASTHYKFFYEYDPIADQYNRKADLKTSRAASSMVIFENQIYILGHSTPKGNGSPVERYDISTDSWHEFSKLTSWRYQSSAIVVNNNLYIIGGTNGNAPLKTVEQYSLENPEFPNPEEPGTSPEFPSTPPVEGNGYRAILVITMTTGLQKEFDLSMEEVNDFVSWYEKKHAGSGTASYAIDKHNNNIGPFKSRREYMIYDKILTFEVSEYTK